MQNYIQTINKTLDNLKENSCFRTIKNIQYKSEKFITVNNKKMLNLSSNDYLNISTDRDLINEFIDRYKNGNEFIFSSENVFSQIISQLLLILVSAK